MGMVVTKQGWILGLTAMVVLLAGSLWYFHPRQRLERSWEGLLGAVEAQSPRRIGNLLADDYADRWGYTKKPLVEDARLAFYAFDEVELRAEQLQITREGNRALIQAVIRMEARGSGQADRARVEVNSLFTPCTFGWRREAGFPWSWKLVRFDHPELDLDQFRRSAMGIN